MFETITMTDISRILFVLGFLFIFIGLKNMYRNHKKFKKSKEYKDLQEEKNRITKK